MFRQLFVLVNAALAIATLPPIQVKGNALYQKGNDTRFYLRGVDYQPGGSSAASDPLADSKGCARDVPYFQQLGINTIRVYTVDNSQNHDDCMKMLDDAGIYLMLDTSTPKASLNRADPGPSYNAAYLQNVFATIDAFKGYDNLLGFIAANEVIDDEGSTGSAPYVKALVRDMKSYLKAQSRRQVPVIYSAADVSLNRWQQMEYFNCGDDDTRIDIFGMNDYSYCPPSSFEQSGYAANVQQYANYSIPMIFSEFGCNKKLPRTFDEIGVIFSDDMSPVYSGGCVYQYNQDSSNYGLVSVDGDNVSTLDDFNNLKSQLAAHPDPTGDAGAATTKSAATCPSSVASTWDVSGSSLPAMPKDASQYLFSGAGKAQGTRADTQNGASAPAAGSNSPLITPTGSGSPSSGSSSVGSSSSAKASASKTKSKGAGSVQTVPVVRANGMVLPVALVVAVFLTGVCLL